MRIVLKYLTLAAAALVVTHLAVSAAMSVITAHLYHHRMINVRHLDSHPNRAPALIAAFLRSFVGRDKPKVLIVGSSFAWGYSWPEKQVFSWHLQNARPDLDVINASVIGDSLHGTVETLCLAGKIGLRFNAVLVEMNLNNLNISQWTGRCQRYAVGNLGRCGAKIGTWRSILGVDYLPFFVTSPFGLSHFRIIRDEYDYDQPERKFSFAPLPESYFPTAEEFDVAISELSELFGFLAAAGAKVSDNVVVFFSPIATEGVRRGQFNQQEIKRQLDTLHALCERQPKLRCLPIENDLPLEYFGNVTHLNLAGHAFYGRYLAGELAQPVTASAARGGLEPVSKPVRPPAAVAKK